MVEGAPPLSFEISCPIGFLMCRAAEVQEREGEEEEVREVAKQGAWIGRGGRGLEVRIGGKGHLHPACLASE
jgi:hypothetical protein